MIDFNGILAAWVPGPWFTPMVARWLPPVGIATTRVRGRNMPVIKGNGLKPAEDAG